MLTLLVDEGGAQPRITLDELGATAQALRRVARADTFLCGSCIQQEAYHIGQLILHDNAVRLDDL